MQDAPVLVGHRPVVHLATGTVVGWRLGRTRIPTDPDAHVDHLRAAVRQMAATLLATDDGRRSMRFAVIEATVDEAAALADHLSRAVPDLGIPGRRFGVVFPGEQIASRPEEHVHLERLVGLGVGVGFDAPDLGDAFDAVRLELPVTRLRVRIPADGAGCAESDDRTGLSRARTDARATEARLAAVIELARRRGIRTTVTGIDTAQQELLARRAGADVGTGDHLGPVCETPVLDVRPSEGTLATVQRLTHMVHGSRDHAWAGVGG